MNQTITVERPMHSTGDDGDKAVAPVSTALLAESMRCMATAAMMTDLAGRIVWVNEAMCSLSGYDASELCGKTPAILQSGKLGDDFYRTLWDTISASSAWRGSVTDKRKDGSLFTAAEIISPVIDGVSGQRYYLAILQDISDLEVQYQRARYRAHHDSLTGLPNRCMFLEVATKALAGAARASQLAALMFVDLDGFKTINDRLGHRFGDLVLVEVATRLFRTVRQADTVARLGGDEFAILALNLPNKAAGENLARKLLETLDGPCKLQSRNVALRASIGIAFFPDHGLGVDTLLAQADRAMYRAKRAGGRRALAL